MRMLGDPRNALAQNGTLRGRDSIIRDTAHEYLETLNPDDTSLSQIGDEILAAINDQIKTDNMVRGLMEEKTHKSLATLPPSVIGDIILTTQNIRRIAGGGLEQDANLDQLGVYTEDGENAGIYVVDDEQIQRMAKEINYLITDRDVKEVISHIRVYAERTEISTDQDKIAVNNGIFDFKKKTLQPFDPDHVFLSKIPVDYNSGAMDVKITNSDGSIWTVESWMKSLSSDPKIVQLLWEGVSALVRPNVSWDKAIFLISSKGCNGKGTYLAMLRELAGTSAASVSLKQLGERFGAASLYGKTAVLSDENDTGAIVENAEVFKSIVTHDTFTMEKKHKDPFAYRFNGIAVFCANSIPRFRDRTKSLYRRILAVPFDKNFYQNGENKAIKSDYIHRKDVLEYVLYRALHCNVYKLSEPDSCRVTLEDVRIENDMVVQYCEEVLPHFSWDLIPFTLAYKIYQAFVRETNPSAHPLGRNKFINELIDLLDEKDYGFYCPDKNIPIKVGDLMQGSERMIIEYNILDWMDKHYTGPDLDKISKPELSSAYRGIIRRDRRDRSEDPNVKDLGKARDF